MEAVALQTLAEYGARAPLPLDDNMNRVDESEGPLFDVIQQAERRTPNEVIKENDQVHLSVAVEIMERIDETTGISHREKLIHSNLKPKNVIRSKDTDGNMIAKVLDFGFPLMIETTMGSQLPTRIAGMNF